jgi:hypothetical protein
LRWVGAFGREQRLKGAEMSVHRWKRWARAMGACAVAQGGGTLWIRAQLSDDAAERLERKD